MKRMRDPQVYRVPDERPDGTRVKILEFDHGYFTVEHEGKRFRIFSICVDEESIWPPLQGSFGRTPARPARNTIRETKHSPGS